MEKYRTCTLCEAMCGLKIEVNNGIVQSIKGDEKDPFSRGHICPKALALKDLHEDPNRIRTPLLREGERWIPIPWNQAIEWVARKIVALQQRYDEDAFAIYAGNPNVHNLGSMLYLPTFTRLLKTRNRFSASSVDQWPHQQVAFHMYGHQFLVPIPDLDNLDLFVIMGGNPLASNGSMMTAPDLRTRLKTIRDRGHLVVIDPRQTETAKLAQEHLAIRPGSDAFFLSGILRYFFENNLIDQGAWQSYSENLEALHTFVSAFSYAEIERHTQIPTVDLQRLAQRFAEAPRAAWYGRVGVSTQKFGATSQWLIQAINLVAGKFDRPGGVLFPNPAAPLLNFISKGHFDRWQSRVSKWPEFSGELPLICLREEIETEGPGQIRGLLVAAGNPVVSNPDGARLEEALQKLEFLVCVDFYKNETSRHAHLILPPASPLERDHFDLIFHQLAIRNTVKYSPPTFPRSEGSWDDGQIYAALACSLARLKKRPWKERLRLAYMRRISPARQIAWALKRGPHGVSMKALRENPHGIDLGPLEPQAPANLPKGKVDLAPARYLADLERMKKEPQPCAEFVVVGRRHLLNNNSWLRHIPHLTKGKNRMTLHIHPEDAQTLNLANGGLAQVSTQTGSITVLVETDAAMARGVVSLPYGFSDRAEPETNSPFAHQFSLNDIIPLAADACSGNAILNGVAVEIQAVGEAKNT